MNLLKYDSLFGINHKITWIALILLLKRSEIAKWVIKTEKVKKIVILITLVFVNVCFWEYFSLCSANLIISRLCKTATVKATVVAENIIT